MKKLYIIGGKSTALEIRETVDLYYFSEFDVINNVIGDNEHPIDYSFVRDMDITHFDKDDSNENYYIISFTNFKLRHKFINILKKINFTPFIVIHPKAFVAKSATIGANVYISKGAVVSSYAIVNDNCIININSTVGHDAELSENVVLNPGSVVGGGAKISNNVLIGGNSFIKQGITIGSNVLVDAMTYVNKDIGPNIMCTNNSKLSILKIFINERKSRTNN